MTWFRHCRLLQPRSSTSQSPAHVHLHFTARGIKSSFPTRNIPKKPECADSKIWCSISSVFPYCTPLSPKSGFCVSRRHPPVHRSPSHVWAQHHHSAPQLAAVRSAKHSFFSSFSSVLRVTGLTALTGHSPASGGGGGAGGRADAVRPSI